jgi:hypothetical protein
MTRLNVDGARCEALFASGLQRSDALTATSVAEAIGGAVSQFGARGGAGRMAQKFGDHPQAAAERMRWVRQLAARTTARPRASPGHGATWAGLLAQGWTIWPAGEHALTPQVNECPGASWQHARRGRGSSRSPRILRCRFRRLRALVLVCWRGRSGRAVLSG